MRFAEGQADGEGASLPRGALARDFTRVKFDEMFDQIETEAGAGNIADVVAFHTFVLAEEAGSLLFRHAEPFILHLDGHMVVPIRPGRYGDQAAIRGVFDGIAEQVGEDLIQFVFIRLDQGR